MTELFTVPDDLRNVLEHCLAEDATAENLRVYLPTVRQIEVGDGLRRDGSTMCDRDTSQNSLYKARMCERDPAYGTERRTERTLSAR